MNWCSEGKAANKGLAYVGTQFKKNVFLGVLTLVLNITKYFTMFEIAPNIPRNEKIKYVSNLG